jgi:predicted nucleic acid-binding protein
LERGLLWKQSSNKLKFLRNTILPLLDYIFLERRDWMQAADFWAKAVRRGRQLDDVDLLLASLARRLQADVVTSDADFDPLPVQRES